jgi:hypothetical protein
VIDRDGEEWLVPADAAARLGISRKLIYTWIDRGVDIRVVQVGRRMAVNVGDVATAEHAWRTRTRGGHRQPGFHTEPSVFRVDSPATGFPYPETGQDVSIVGSTESPHREVASRECAAPHCQAKPLPMLRIPLCRDCASDVTHQYWAERDAILNPSPGQGAEEAARAAAGDLSPRGHVYFIRFSDRIKIGFTADLRTRLAALPWDEVLRTVPGTMADEKRCHAAFAHLRVVGEWFTDTPELREFIAGITS